MAPMTPPPLRGTPARYVELVNARALDELIDLFSPNAEMLNPLGAVLHGHDEIRAFYRDVALASSIELHPMRSFTNGFDTALEFEGRIDGTVVMLLVDLFNVGEDGLIRRLAVYTRPLLDSES
jgi:hypothetical protein